MRERSRAGVLRDSSRDDCSVSIARVRTRPLRPFEANGDRVCKTVETRGLEGFVAKDPQSSYRSGPTRSWIKVKRRREVSRGALRAPVWRGIVERVTAPGARRLVAPASTRRFSG